MSSRPADASTYRGTSLIGLKPNQIAELRRGAHLPEDQRVHGPDRLRQRADRPAPALRQKPLAILLGLPSVAREEQQLADAATRDAALPRPRARAPTQQASSLPYGELRLLEVAVALAAKPKLLLLDEPVSGMNPSETTSFMQMLARIRALGITVLLVEHDMKMVMGVSDRVVCLNHGRIIASGAPAEIQRNPDVIRAYLGERYVRAQG